MPRTQWSSEHLLHASKAIRSLLALGQIGAAAAFAIVSVGWYRFLNPQGLDDVSSQMQPILIVSTLVGYTLLQMGGRPRDAAYFVCCCFPLHPA